MEYFNLLKKYRIAYSDLRENVSISHMLKMENGVVTVNSRINASLKGLRVFNNNGLGFVYFNDGRLSNAFKKALNIARAFGKYSNEKQNICNYKKVKYFEKNVNSNIFDISDEEKIEFLKQVTDELKEHPRIKNTLAVVYLSEESKNFLNSEFSEINLKQHIIRLNIFVTMKDRNNLQEYYYTFGKQGGWEVLKKIDINALAKKVINKCETLLRAKPAPAGRYPVILDPEITGVFFHEAIGHACEADAVLENQSLFKNKLGERVASDLITLYDDPTLPESSGSYLYDDEGIKARRTILIEKGILKSYLHSRTTAAKMKQEPTGNGRSEFANALPIPRMSNIVLKEGGFSEEELFESIKKGIFLVGSRGGVVEPTKGNFLFNAKEAFLIENGKITTPLRGVSLSGNSLKILNKISGVGKKARLSFTAGQCGKKGQRVPVDEKAPFIKIDEAIVGGRDY